MEFILFVFLMETLYTTDKLAPICNITLWHNLEDHNMNFMRQETSTESTTDTLNIHDNSS
jgi:hypothetical protein